VKSRKAPPIYPFKFWMTQHKTKEHTTNKLAVRRLSRTYKRKTHKITTKDNSLEKLLDKYVTSVEESSVLVVTSKVVAICEGRVVKIDLDYPEQKDRLVREDAQHYVPREHNEYGFAVTITHNKLIASAGIDESNGNGYYVLWPQNPQESANRIREYLVKRFKKKNLGVLITDSHAVPFVWGVIGIALSHSGFEATRNYIGKPDIFGQNLHVTHQSNTEGLAAAADVVMGGAAEQTPLVQITDIPFVKFQNRNPSDQELEAIKITRDADLFWPLMKNAPWQKGKNNI